MLPELNDNDWEEAFGFAVDNMSRAIPDSNVSLDRYSREDVVRIIAKKDGENDGENWKGVFELQDGRFVFVSAGCDYSEWD